MAVNVLIVDDSAVMRKIVERSVRAAWREPLGAVLEAADGAEALDTLKAGPVDAVFLNIQMPNGNGLELLRLLQGGALAEIPVIAFAGEGGETAVMEAIALGASSFVKKPFNTAEMESAMVRALGTAPVLR